MKINNPRDIKKTLEIYEYYDGPLSSLIEFKDGRKAFREIVDYTKESLGTTELVIMCSDEEIQTFKKQELSMKKFIIEKTQKKEVILWNHKKGTSLLVELKDIEFILKNMNNEYKFKDTSGDWKDYC